MFEAIVEDFIFTHDFECNNVLCATFPGEVYATELSPAEGFSNLEIFQFPVLSLGCELWISTKRCFVVNGDCWGNRCVVNRSSFAIHSVFFLHRCRHVDVVKESKRGGFHQIVCNGLRMIVYKTVYGASCDYLRPRLRPSQHPAYQS